MQLVFSGLLLVVIGILLIVCLYTIVFDGFWICIPLNLNQYFIIDTFLLLSDKLIIDDDDDDSILIYFPPSWHVDLNY